MFGRNKAVMNLVLRSGWRSLSSNMMTTTTVTTMKLSFSAMSWIQAGFVFAEPTLRTGIMLDGDGIRRIEKMTQSNWENM